MIAAIVRGFASVITVLTAVIITGLNGETATTKVLAATISAAVIIGLEFAVRLAPRYSTRVRRALDERFVWEGVWVQTVTERRIKGGDSAPAARNDFSVFRVVYDSHVGYLLEGRAFDDTGFEIAQWRSIESATFSWSGRRLSYIWGGKAWQDPDDPVRHGLGTMLLLAGEDDAGIGDVEHVKKEISMSVKLERVNEEMLAQPQFQGAFTLKGLERDEARRRFAKVWATARDEPAATTSVVPSANARRDREAHSQPRARPESSGSQTRT